MRVMELWIRWASLWKTSTRSAPGERRISTPERLIDAAGQLVDGTPVSGPEDLRKALMKHPEQFVQTLTEKLMTYGLGRGLEYYDMPHVRKIVRDAAPRQLSFFIDRVGYCEKRTISNEESSRDSEQLNIWHTKETDIMFITKKHLSRRTFLRGAGVAVGLPLLDAMVPAWTALAQTAAKPTPHMGFIYFPLGAIMDQWTPAAEGKSFELPPIH